MNIDKVVKYGMIIFLFITAIELSLPYFTSIFLDIVYVMRSYCGEFAFLFLAFKIFEDKLSKILLTTLSFYFAFKFGCDIMYYIPDLKSLYLIIYTKIGYLIVLLMAILYQIFYFILNKRKNGRLATKKF